MLPVLVFLLLSRLAGADEEESVRIFLCIGFIKMQQNSIRRMIPFRRAIDLNLAQACSSIWEHLNPPARAVPSQATIRRSTSQIVEKLKFDSDSEFRHTFRLSRTDFEIGDQPIFAPQRALAAHRAHAIGRTCLVHLDFCMGQIRCVEHSPYIINSKAKLNPNTALMGYQL